VSIGTVWRTLVPYAAGVTVFFVLMGVTDEWSMRNLILGAVGMALALALVVILHVWQVRRRPSG
jgi:hypothetical protein